jgi:hypothetical protein
MVTTKNKKTKTTKTTKIIARKGFKYKITYKTLSGEIFNWKVEVIGNRRKNRSNKTIVPVTVENKGFRILNDTGIVKAIKI